MHASGFCSLEPHDLTYIYTHQKYSVVQTAVYRNRAECSYCNVLLYCATKHREGIECKILSEENLDSEAVLLRIRNTRVWELEGYCIELEISVILGDLEHDERSDEEMAREQNMNDGSVGVDPQQLVW